MNNKGQALVEFINYQLFTFIIIHNKKGEKNE